MYACSGLREGFDTRDLKEAKVIGHRRATPMSILIRLISG
jgi:hypothetical protein